MSDGNAQGAQVLYDRLYKGYALSFDRGLRL